MVVALVMDVLLGSISDPRCAVCVKKRVELLP